MVTDPAPIIVTALMAPADQLWAEGLRRRHYPSERNQVAAHITLFHHLPPSVEAELKGQLIELSRAPRPAAWVEGVFSLGRGVALLVRSPELLAIRARLAERFDGLLTPQDRAPPRLHITVQNKVDPATARATLATLEAEIAPRPLVIAGLACSYYRGGPWEQIAARAFRGKR